MARYLLCGGLSNRKTTRATGKQIVWFKDKTLIAKNIVMTKEGKTEREEDIQCQGAQSIS